jgi:hypothetical protein
VAGSGTVAVLPLTWTVNAEPPTQISSEQEMPTPYWPVVAATNENIWLTPDVNW